MKKVIQVANPNRAQFTKCASYAIPSTTQLLCEASGKSAPNITWTTAIGNGSESNVMHRGSTWNMVNIKRTNSGTYRCTAYNGAGNADSFVVNINITCKNNYYFFSLGLINL